MPSSTTFCRTGKISAYTKFQDWGAVGNRKKWLPKNSPAVVAYIAPVAQQGLSFSEGRPPLPRGLDNSDFKNTLHQLLEYISYEQAASKIWMNRQLGLGERMHRKHEGLFFKVLSFLKNSKSALKIINSRIRFNNR